MKITFDVPSVLLLAALMIAIPAASTAVFWLVIMAAIVIADTLQRERWEKAERLRRMHCISH